MEVRFKSYATSDVQTSLNDLVNVVDASQYVDGARPFASDPDGWLLRAATAARQYSELSVSDYDTLCGYFSHREVPGESSLSMPAEAVTTYMTARNSGLFDKFELLSHPVTREAVLVGFVEGGKARRRLVICQWGPRITTIKKLRSRRYRVGRQLAEFWNENSPFSGYDHGPVYFAIVALLATAVPWTLFAFALVGWWVFFACLAGALVLVGKYVKADGTQTAVRVCIAVAIVSVIAAIVTGFVRLDRLGNEEQTKEVLVCRVSEGLDTYQRHLHWILHTPDETMIVQPGFYDDVYYEAPSKELADKYVGKVVMATTHGYIDGPYVTKITSLRAGSCG